MGSIMSHKHVLACLLLAALVGSCAPAPALSEGEARIRRVENGLVPVSAAGPTRLAGTRPLADHMAHHGVLGLSIAVIDGYQLAWARGYGVLDAQTSEPVTPDTLFHAGSVAKTLSADAALSLVQEGRLVWTKTSTSCWFPGGCRRTGTPWWIK